MDTFRVLGCVCAFAVVAVVALDRGWFGAPADLWSAQTDATKLEAGAREVTERHRFNRAVLTELADDRLSLEETVRVILRVNGSDRGYMAWVQQTFPDDRLDKTVARNVIARVEGDLAHDPDRRAAVVARLEAEYTAWFGVSPPPR